MKFLIIVAFIAVIVAVHAGELTEEQKANVKQYITECKEQIKVTDEEIAQLRTADFPNASEDVKCFSNCFLEKAGVFVNGALQEAVLIEKFAPIVGEGKAKKILDLCRGETGANKCETAFNLQTCFRKNKGIVE